MPRIDCNLTGLDNRLKLGNLVEQYLLTIYQGANRSMQLSIAVHGTITQSLVSLFNRKDVLLLHDSASPHVVLDSRKKLQYVK